MARQQARAILTGLSWKCSSCQAQTKSAQSAIHSLKMQRKPFTTTRAVAAEVMIRAAPEINFEADIASSKPARIIPSSPSYFTASPVFNDNILLLQTLVKKHQSLPNVTSDKAPCIVWMKLSQYRSTIGETIGAAKYSRVLLLLGKLNRIHPNLRPREVLEVMERYRRPGSADVKKAKPGTIDGNGRSKGIGRRKESSARVYLVEGDGQVLVNGRSVLQAFPRLHDRESALWALKVTERMDKYNVFALVEGGGITGQAESITLALARALLVHEPALKPALRRAGCVTSDARRVERKKPGRLKARKKPAWVKR